MPAKKKEELCKPNEHYGSQANVEEASRNQTDHPYMASPSQSSTTSDDECSDLLLPNDLENLQAAIHNDLPSTVSTLLDTALTPSNETEKLLDKVDELEN